MKFSETKEYKNILNIINYGVASIVYLNNLKNSELGKQIEKFCNGELERFTNGTEKIYYNHLFDGVQVVIPNGMTCVFRSGEKFYVDTYIESEMKDIQNILKEKKKLDALGIEDVSREETQEFYNRLADLFQSDKDVEIHFNEIDSYNIRKTKMMFEAIIYYNIAKGKDDFLYNTKTIIIPGRSLYLINGNVYKASQREVDRYCAAHNCTAQLVELKHLEEKV